MNPAKKLLIALLALVLALTVCGAVLAESEPAVQASETEQADTTGNDVAGSNYSIGMFVTDGEGKSVPGGGLLSCTPGNINLMIQHDYVLTAMYYDAQGKTYETSDRLILGVETDSEYVQVDQNTIRLSAAPKPYFFSIRVVDPTKEEGEAKYNLDVKQFKVEFSDLLVAGVGVYVIVSAIRGAGSLFNDEFIKEDKKPKFKKLMRIICIVIGVAFLISAALAIAFSYLDWVMTVRYVLFGIGLAGLIAMFVLNTVFTDKEKRAKAQQTARTGGPSHSSAAAFEFDGTEPTLDEVLADLEKQEAEAPEDKGDE